MAKKSRPTSATNPAAHGGDGQALLAKLTPREREVLVLFLQELDDKKVSARLGTERHTVRNQLASIEHKLGVNNRAELVRFAALCGLIKSS